MATRLGTLCVILVISLLGCVTAKAVVDAPEGFAVYDQETAYRAVSPEGVVVRVRVVDNEPPQTLEFWTQALKTQLEKSGYTFLRGETLDTRAGKASLLEWVAPVGEEDWVYLTGIAVVDRRIAVAEAAGVYELYQKHRQAILDSLGTLEVR